MESNVFYLFTADLILFIHALFIVFLVFGLLLIIAGKLLSWSWVRNPWFRLAHLTGIVIVVIQSWLGIICPLTTWEMALRSKAGSIVYAGSFISYWLKRLVYYQAPEWAFVVCYTTFGLLVAVCWFWIRPRFSETE
ncbi:MAG: DUF2784 domain-containing protein [Desulfobacterales bacterium]|nr:DUF2784 domain-containing protein [Desulfobacterales bacterium]